METVNVALESASSPCISIGIEGGKGETSFAGVGTTLFFGTDGNSESIRNVRPWSSPDDSELLSS